MQVSLRNQKFNYYGLRTNAFLEGIFYQEALATCICWCLFRFNSLLVTADKLDECSALWGEPERVAGCISVS